MQVPLRSCFLAGVVASILAPVSIAAADTPAAPHPGGGPTAASALAAEEELAKAMRENDADGIARMLTDDWAVITAHGDVGEGKDIFPSGIRSGALTRKIYEISEPRVRVDGHTAVVTTKVHLAGVFSGKPFDVMERVSDVFVWQGGAWKAMLTHETFFHEKSAT